MKPLWRGGALLRKDGSKTTGHVRLVVTDDHQDLLPHSAAFKGKFLGILPSKAEAQEAVEEAAGLTRRRLLRALLGVNIFKARRKLVVIPDAAMDENGMLIVAVPVEYQEGIKVYLNGRELRNKVDYRATPGGIYPLPGPYLVEWKAHRARHKVTF